MRVLFDLDGTLCDPRLGLFHGFRHALEGQGRVLPPEEQLAPLIGLPLKDCFLRLGLGEASEDAARAFQSFFEARGFAEARLYPGVEQVLEGLRARGSRLAIASAKPGFAVKFVAEGLGILRHFEGCFGCEPSDLSPHKGPIVAAALSGLGWRAEDTVMVGDRAQDRDAARANGLRFVAAAWGFGSPEEHDGADAVADSPAELALILQGLDALLPQP